MHATGRHYVSAAGVYVLVYARFFFYWNVSNIFSSLFFSDFLFCL